MSDNAPDFGNMTPEQIAEQLDKQFDPEKHDKSDVNPDDVKGGDDK